jgi:hypothetical protein
MHILKDNHKKEVFYPLSIIDLKILERLKKQGITKR